MGFYVRKSISVGPFRFNLSGSGLGVSTGVKGLRFGIGPRGNYVQMGKGGLYYRATIPVVASSPHVTPSAPVATSPPASNTHSPLEEIDSASSSTLIDSSSKEVLEEMDRKSKTWQYLPIVAGVFVALLIAGFFTNWPSWLLMLIAVTGAVAAYISRRRDVLAKTTVLFYDLDATAEAAFQELHNSNASMASCSRIWHIEASGRVHDSKYHAGASDLVRRKSSFIRRSEMPFVKSNVETFAFGVGKQTLYFFPDRVFVHDQAGVGAVSYPQLKVMTAPTRFIEEEGVPGDAKVVDRTWKYVNKKGGPDRRFNNNRELPICEYEKVVLTSATGLNELIQLSKVGAAQDFGNAVVRLGLAHTRRGGS